MKRRTLLKKSVISKSNLKKIRYLLPSFEPDLPKGKQYIKVCEPDLRGNELEYVNDCVTSEWISSQGTYVNKFEEKFAKFCGVKYAIAVTNGSHALQLALAVLGIGLGDEVIVPTFTMVATANAVTVLGARPVFVDARADTWNIDETKIESAITSKTKAIIVVHIYGHPVEMDTIAKIAKKHNLWVIEDAAEAHGATYKGKKVGSIGDIGCFSFYANKMITTGEGGMVTTNNKRLSELMYKLHNHAFDDEIHFWHQYVGYNFRMTNLQAAVGCAQLERIEHMIQLRKKNATLYKQYLAGVQGIQLPVEKKDVENTYWMFGIVLDESFPLSRDQLRQKLAEQSIETRTFFIPLHLQPIYFDSKYLSAYPVANMLCQRGLYLPSSSTLRPETIEFITSIISSPFPKTKKDTRTKHSLQKKKKLIKDTKQSLFV